MYNMDETGFLLGISDRGKVAVRQGRRNVEEMTDGSRDWVTAMETCGTTAMLPQTLIYKGKSIQRDWVKDIDVDGAVSDKGYMPDELTIEFLRGEPDLCTSLRRATGHITLFPSSATLFKTISFSSPILATPPISSNHSMSSLLPAAESLRQSCSRSHPQHSTGCNPTAFLAVL